MAITHSKDSALLTHWFLRPSVGERLPVHKADRVMGSKPSIYCVPMMPTPPAWAYAWMGSRQTANGCAPGWNRSPCRRIDTMLAGWFH